MNARCTQHEREQGLNRIIQDSLLPIAELALKRINVWFKRRAYPLEALVFKNPDITKDGPIRWIGPLDQHMSDTMRNINISSLSPSVYFSSTHLASNPPGCVRSADKQFDKRIVSSRS